MSDRRRFITGGETTGVKRRTVAVLGVVAVGFLATAGIGSALVGVGPVSDAVSVVTDDEERKPPALTAFDTGPVHCPDDFMANSSTRMVGGGPNTEITYARNRTLPDPSAAIGDPTFERLNESAYVLSIPAEETNGTTRDCAGVVRYEAEMRIPAGDDPWEVVVEHDGERVTTLYGESDSAGVSGSASAGGSASGGSAGGGNVSDDGNASA